MCIPAEDPDPSLPGSPEPGGQDAADVQVDHIRPSTGPTLVIVDWDDTILPTTWLLLRKILLPGRASVESLPAAAKRAQKEHRALLQSVADAVTKTLDAAEQLGEVAVVTNATLGWVESCLDSFFPSLADRVGQYPILARPPDFSVDVWKPLKFEQLSQHYGTLISLGDGVDERAACLRLAGRVRVRNIRLAGSPFPADLVAQHAVIARSLAAVCKDLDDLDLHLACQLPGNRTTRASRPDDPWMLKHTSTIGKDPVPATPISETVAEQRLRPTSSPSLEPQSKSRASSSRASLSARLVTRLLRFARMKKSGLGWGKSSTGIHQESMSTASTASGSGLDDMSVVEALDTKYDGVVEAVGH